MTDFIEVPAYLTGPGAMEEDSDTSRPRSRKSRRKRPLIKEEPTSSLQGYNPYGFNVHTVPGGINSGRIYSLRCNTAAECTIWVDALQRHVVSAKQRSVQISLYRKLQVRRQRPHPLPCNRWRGADLGGAHPPYRSRSLS